MSLLPIIYSSLIITGGLLIFAFTVSYISYKFKNKRENIKEQTAPHQINRNNIRRIRQTSKHITKSPNIPNPRAAINYGQPAPVRSVKLSQESKYNHTISTRKRDSRQTDITERKLKPNTQKKVVHQLIEIKPDYMKKSSVGKIKNRLEIVNPMRNSSSQPQTHGTEKKYSDHQPAERHIPDQNHPNNKADILTLKSSVFAQTGT